MMHRIRAVAGLALVAIWTSVALGQAPAPAVSSTEPAKAAPTEQTAVTVNGYRITKSEVEDKCDAVLKEQARGQAIPPGQRIQLLERLTPQILEALIDNRLLDEDAAKAKTTASDAELTTEMERLLRLHLVRTGATREEFEKQLQDQIGQSVKELVATRVANPDFKQSFLHQRHLKKKFAKELVVTEEAVKGRYEERLEREYSKPEMVQASHILIGTDAGVTDEDRAAALKKAETVLGEVRKPGADFAALAAEHSTCPSKAKGGDLGFFPRQGAMVEPFAAAAFTLKTGEITDVVETRFGYHIIKATNKKAAVVVSLKEASETIRQQLEAEKLGELRQGFVADLRKAAEITYPEGKTPPAAP